MDKFLRKSSLILYCYTKSVSVKVPLTECTAFLYNFTPDSNAGLAIITAQHVRYYIDSLNFGFFIRIPVIYNDKDSVMRFDSEFASADDWVCHPQQDCDLCCIPLRKLTKSAIPDSLTFAAFYEDLIPEDDLSLGAGEAIKMIGVAGTSEGTTLFDFHTTNSGFLFTNMQTGDKYSGSPVVFSNKTNHDIPLLAGIHVGVPQELKQVYELYPDNQKDSKLSEWLERQASIDKIGMAIKSTAIKQLSLCFMEKYG